LSYRFEVDAEGQARSVKLLANSLRLRAGAEETPALVRAAIEKQIRGFRFQRKSAGSKVTLPIVFSA